MASPNSSKSPPLIDDKMEDEDSLLLDDEGNIKSAQPQPPNSPVKIVKSPPEYLHLTKENFRIV